MSLSFMSGEIMIFGMVGTGLRGVPIWMPKLLFTKACGFWAWKDHTGITENRISIPNAKCGKRFAGFVSKFGGEKVWISL
jgi:hypothetical protein